MAIYNPPEYPFAFDSDIRPYSTLFEADGTSKTADISPMIGDESKLVRWYAPWASTLPPRALRPKTNRWEDPALSYIKYREATQKIIDLARLHFDELRAAGMRTVKPDFQLSPRGVPGDHTRPGILFSVEKLPERIKPIGRATPEEAACICQPLGRYLSWAMNTGNEVLYDMSYTHQYSRDPDEAVALTVAHDTEPRFEAIYGPDGNYTDLFEGLLHVVSEVEYTAQISDGVATRLVAEAA